MKKLIISLLIVLFMSASVGAGWDLVKTKEYIPEYVKEYKFDQRCPVCNYEMPRPKDGKWFMRVIQNSITSYYCVCNNCGVVFMWMWTWTLEKGKTLRDSQE